VVPVPDAAPTPQDRPEAHGPTSAVEPTDTVPKVAERARPTVVVIIVGFITLFVCLLAFGRIAELVYRQEAVALDAVVTPLLHAAASPVLDQLMWSFTTIGSTLVVAPLFVVVEVLLLLSSRRREALFLAVATLGSVLLNASMKLFFQRPRPQLPWAQTPLDYSFPSGHTMNGLVFYLALALVIRVIAGPRVGVLAVALATTLAVLIGISRIYLGAHYFSDVAAGFLAGLAWLVIVSAAFDASDWFARRRTRRGGASPPGVPATSGQHRH
jgi:membrane-associated phospholipid phosphatase